MLFFSLQKYFDSTMNHSKPQAMTAKTGAATPNTKLATVHTHLLSFLLRIALEVESLRQ